MSLAGRIEHLRFRRFLDAAVDGELPTSLELRVRRHIAACPMCARDEVTTVLVKRRLPIVGRLRPVVPPHDRPGA